jgi:hypothetical protein
MYRDGNHNEEILLKQSIVKALQEADTLKQSSVAMYSVASCSYNFPQE